MIDLFRWGNLRRCTSLSLPGGGGWGGGRSRMGRSKEESAESSKPDKVVLRPSQFWLSSIIPNDEGLFRAIDKNVGYPPWGVIPSTCPNMLRVPHLTRFKTLRVKGNFCLHARLTFSRMYTQTSFQMFSSVVCLAGSDWHPKCSVVFHAGSGGHPDGLGYI